MKEYQVSHHNIDAFIDELIAEINTNKVMIVSTQSPSVGKWSMARLWRKWMSTTAEFMASHGVTVDIKNSAGQLLLKKPFTGNDAHELFTSHHLGLDEQGRRLSWAKSLKKENSDKERLATKGERFHAMRKHSEWCVEKGITLFKPRDSEYAKLEAEQE